MAKAKQPRGLSVKQRRFVEAYDGNATAAAIAAGYSPKTARSVGQENLTKPDIAKAIKDRENKRMESTILTREERQAFWSDIIRNEDEKNIMAKLKASELLAKSEGDFLDRHELTGKDGAALDASPRKVILSFEDAPEWTDDGGPVD
jgi:phage terminase small subunit